MRTTSCIPTSTLPDRPARIPPFLNKPSSVPLPTGFGRGYTGQGTNKSEVTPTLAEKAPSVVYSASSPFPPFKSNSVKDADLGRMRLSSPYVTCPKKQGGTTEGASVPKVSGKMNSVTNEGTKQRKADSLLTTAHTCG